MPISHSPSPITAFVGLGSNLHHPATQLQAAFDELGRLPDTRLLATSSLYRSAPVGFADQPDFVNAVAAVETRLPPREVLTALLEIEHRHGRVRHFRNGPRVLDLDLLIHGDLVHHEEGLTLPHPRMHERAFVLLPLLEIAPDCVIPGLGPAREYLGACRDQYVEAMSVQELMEAELADRA